MPFDLVQTVLSSRLRPSLSLFVWLAFFFFPKKVFESGMCGCTDYNLESGDDYIEIMNSMVFMTEYIGDFSSDVKRSVINALCNMPANDGDHLQVRAVVRFFSSCFLFLCVLCVMCVFFSSFRPCRHMSINPRAPKCTFNEALID